MLELREIVKEYYTQDETVRALKGVSVKFRESEFVSILGPSGCGKTTLLNIVGGLDRYTSGDLIINGKSTTKFTDKDWDTYRNHSIGFVFQSYNLIPHQTVLENVELALTLSGVKAAERRERAKAVLEKVGLGSKINARPNQLSGGQMQRVAIARALINNPDILLADEPTGALDSKTSVQIMDLLKEISSEMLIIMVTHNPELAEKYSSRIIRLLDGELVGDDNPVSDEEAAEIIKADEEKEAKLAAESADAANGATIKPVKEKKKRTSMSFLTALSLSFKNLLTKKTRTLLVSFAGSIGIIGIAIILSLSSGFQNYINGVQRDTLSNYPVQIMQKYTNFSALMMGGGEPERDKSQKYPDGSDLKVNDTIGELYREFMKETQPNDIQSFKYYLDNCGYDKTKITAIQYSYSVDFDVYGKPYGGADGETKLIKNAIKDMIKKWSEGSGYGTQVGGMDAGDVYFPVWSEMIDNVDVIQSQYELVGGSKWISPEDTDKIMVVANAYNEIPSYVLASVGLAPEPSLTEKSPDLTYKVEDLIGKEFYLLTKPLTYVKSEKKYVEETDESKLEELAKTKGRKVSIAGVIRPKEGVAATSISGYLVYSSGLTKALISDMNNTELVEEQRREFIDAEENGGKAMNLLKGVEVLNNQNDVYDVLGGVGLVDPESPSAINIYPATFEDKDYVNSLIEAYNRQFPEEGEGSEKRIKYDDYLGMALSSMTTIINAVSYVLIGFVSVSLVVSSIMIGIITYISVLERIKEIGVLRALGASKTDVSRVFNAETLIIGFAAGIIGIGITVLLNIPISLIIKSLAGISNVATLPWQGGLILVAISMALTLIAGLIPSRMAAKKDPVIALRSE